MSTYIGKRVSYPCSVCGTQFTLSKKSKELPNGDVICPKCVSGAPMTTEEKKVSEAFRYINEWIKQLQREATSSAGYTKGETYMSDIREKILDILVKYGEWYSSDGDPHYPMTGEKAIDAILSIVREAVSAVKPKEWTSVNGLNIQEVNGHNQALSDYHDAILEVLK